MNHLKYFIAPLLILLTNVSYAQSTLKCPNNMVRDSLYYSSLDSLNAFEQLHLLSDSTYSYSHCHNLIGGYNTDYGTYTVQGDVYTFNSNDTSRWNAAINMKMILISEEEMNKYPPSLIFCDGRSKYFVLISNNNVRFMRYRQRIKGI